MLITELDPNENIAILTPRGALSADDFEEAAQVIDPFIEGRGSLDGLIIRTPDFPGWDSFAALLSHFRFVRDHHRQLSRVALVTDSELADMAEKIGRHFVAAEIRHFPYEQFDAAHAWVLSDSQDNPQQTQETP